MPSWPAPDVPALAGEPVPVVLHDTATEEARPIAPEDGTALVYVCGITPYDATHLGHASTYLAFDTLVRALRQSGLRVRYAQNVTDVDDPLLERAAKTDQPWDELAQEQTDLFRSDMTALRVLPPDDYVRVQDVVDEIAGAVAELVANGFGYAVPTTGSLGGDDVYFDVQAAQDAAGFELASVSHFSPERLAAAFVEFGGDPDRAGKRSPLDPLLWGAAREGEPAWPSAVGDGRPGWHVECAVIAAGALGSRITLQGGGRDLRFPHHEMTSAHACALHGHAFADHYAHAGLVAYEGEKMSKSLGNLVLVSKLTAAGADPAAVRLVVLAHHYRSDWEWTDELLDEAHARLERWRAAAARAAAGEAGTASVQALRAAIADDLDTPTALRLVDAWAAEESPAAELLPAIDALLGIDLR
ncbi:MAG: cysteine--1-D-myo-inosityl 2-amino-2-deoxy-alpha-D-glucopyranoside ligase [Microbacteriaceae bacterium]|nr:cysteine--1-D-myo-inosityl 2-amino-2-deoxy-alpha-D-glucopyranoside ligase [Microbacteriaceae bacterium]